MDFIKQFMNALNSVYGLSKLNEKSGSYELPVEYKGLSVSQLITKANEANSTGQAWFGSEFVLPEQLLANVMNRVSNTESLLSLIPATNQFPVMASDVVSIPVKWGKIRMRWAAENANVPGTGADKVKASTAKVTLSAGELAATVYVSYNLLEDSVVNFQTFVEWELAEAFETSMHQFIINGDVTPWTANINNDGGAVDTGADYFQNANGLRFTAIDNGRTVNVWTLDLVDIRTARSLMGLKGAKPSELALIMNQNVYFQLLNLWEVKTKEVFGDAATVVNGVLEAIDGIKIITRDEMPALTDATGKVSSTPGNNTTGSILLAHTPSMFVGFKRQLMIELDKDTSARQIYMTGSTRPAFNLNENDAPAVVLMRNITL